MANGFTGPTWITYSKPRPFTTPTENIRRNVRFSPPTDDIIQRQFIEMSSQYIEEIMVEINLEYGSRGLTPPTWYIYVTQNDSDKVAFTPQRDGRTLNDYAIKFYPSYIRDIQNAIEGLVNDTARPDSLGGHLARAFANNQGIPLQSVWTNDSKLKDGIRVPGNGTGGFTTINPLSNALNGNWPFSPSDIANLLQKIGVTMDGRAQHNVTIDDPNFPQFLVGLPSGNASSRDPNLPQEGRDTPMTVAGRPPRDPRVTQNQLGQNQFDLDQGYGYMGALALSLQQVRYQPPQLETFPTNIQPIWYTSNVVGPLTPNLSWVLAQPAEQAAPALQNWGSWFFSGFVGVQSNRLIIRTLTNPQQAEACQTECPYSLFFPPSTCTCACGCVIESRAIWWSSEYTTLGGGIFMFNEVFPSQASPIRSKAKYFNKNTILRIEGTNSGGRFRIGVQTARIGVIDTPFVYVVDVGVDGTGNLANQNVGSNLPIEINLMEAIAAAAQKTFGADIYEIGGVDALLALSIQTRTGSSAETECPAQFVGTTRVCPNCLGNPCIFGSSNVSIDSIYIGEDSLAGDPIDAY